MRNSHTSDGTPLRGWFPVWAIVGGIALVVNIVTPSSVGHTSLPSLIALVVFSIIFVGPSQEFLFHGLIQTALNDAIGRARPARRRIRYGTVLTALLFGLSHLINLSQQPLSATLLQVAFASAIGLVLGQVHDLTKNIWGAAILHDMSDGLAVIVPLFLGRAF